MTKNKKSCPLGPSNHGFETEKAHPRLHSIACLTYARRSPTSRSFPIQSNHTAPLASYQSHLEDLLKKEQIEKKDQDECATRLDKRMWLVPYGWQRAVCSVCGMSYGLPKAT